VLGRSAFKAYETPAEAQRHPPASAITYLLARNQAVRSPLTLHTFRIIRQCFWLEACIPSATGAILTKIFHLVGCMVMVRDGD
jgi:hypothetical protein